MLEKDLLSISMVAAEGVSYVRVFVPSNRSFVLAEKRCQRLEKFLNDEWEWAQAELTSDKEGGTLRLKVAPELLIRVTTVLCKEVGVITCNLPCAQREGEEDLNRGWND